MWETGSRYNVGQTELHASSLGMVKVFFGHFLGLGLAEACSGLAEACLG